MKTLYVGYENRFIDIIVVNAPVDPIKALKVIRVFNSPYKWHFSRTPSTYIQRKNVHSSYIGVLYEAMNFMN